MCLREREGDGVKGMEKDGFVGACAHICANYVAVKTGEKPSFRGAV